MDWDDLVKAALLGSERQTLQLPATGGDALAATLAGLDASDSEEALLAAAGILAIYRQAGWQPGEHTLPLPEPCPPDERPACSRRAARHLENMLKAEAVSWLYRPVVVEWLGLLNERGMRVPAQHLPALLDLGRTREDVRAKLPAVVGRRGRWLAAQNEAWEYLLHDMETDVAALWQTTGFETRLTLLQRLRTTDPTGARDLLAATWQQEPVQTRATFLEALQVNLSMADEPFLETALDDRGSKVRSVAAELLARLPESRLVARMLARVEPHLVLHKGGLLRQTRIEVTLPGECSAAMQRDGIVPQAPNAQWDPPAWWLAQMLATIPPAHWCARWNVAPEELLPFARHGEWNALFFHGWSQAIVRHADGDWAWAWFNSYPWVGCEEMITLLPRERGATLLLKLLGKDALQQTGPLLERYPCAWNTALARAVLRAVEPHLALKQGQDELHNEIIKLITLASYRIPPTMADEVTQSWQREEYGRLDYKRTMRIDECVRVLRFRRDMDAAL